MCVCVHAHALYCLSYAGEMLVVWCFLGGFTENDQVKRIWELDLEIEHYTTFFYSFQPTLSGLLSEFLLHYWATFKRCPESQKSASTISAIGKLCIFK